jgi:hypothetical protein
MPRLNLRIIQELCFKCTPVSAQIPNLMGAQHASCIITSYAKVDTNNIVSCLWSVQVRAQKPTRVLNNFKSIVQRILGPFCKISYAITSSVMYVCPSAWKNSSRTERTITKFDKRAFKKYIHVYLENSSSIWTRQEYRVRNVITYVHL